MREYRGSLAGRSWVGWCPDHESELEGFRSWVRRQAESGVRVAVDSEGRGLRILSGDPNYLRLVQYGNEDESWVIPVERGGAFREAARWALETLPKTSGHNYAAFDALAFTGYFGLDYDMLVRRSVDTLHLAKLVDPRAKYENGMGAKLKDLSDHYIDPEASDTSGDLTAVFRSLGLTLSTGWAGIDLYHPIYQEYAALDTILVARLLPELTADLDRLGVSQALRSYEGEIARICGRMSLSGMVLDREYTEQLSERLLAEAAEHSATAARYGVENINATAQVISGLGGMGEVFDEFSPKTGKPKVDKSVLSALADIDFQSGERLNKRPPNPLAAAIMKARRAGKWNSAYAQNFLDEADVNGRIHPSISTLAARTGRMSVRNPAVQTLPSGDAMIRRCLLADEGHKIISCDFQAVELRVLAALANVKRMKSAISAGEDLHGFTASMVYGPNYTKAHRKICKGVAFGVCYGGGAATIARQTGAPEDVVAKAVAAYHKAYPEIRRSARKWQREAQQTGMTTVSVTGRRLPLDGHRVYACTNYQIQSAARDVLGQSLINMDAKGLTPYLRLVVHDEVLVSAPAAEATEVAKAIEECMNWSLFDVPIAAEAEIGGRSWASLYGSDY